MKKFFQNLVKGIIYIVFCKILYRVKFINKQNEENLDKCIICPNHSNTVEPAWIYARTQGVNIMAKAELFKNPIIAKIYNFFDVFPIHRGEKDIKSIMHAINLFEGDGKKKLLIFPEGHRIKRNVERGVGKTGPAFIANKANVPIVPVYISKNAKLFSKVKIIYGKPIYVTDEIAKDKEKLKEFSINLVDIIYNLNVNI